MAAKAICDVCKTAVEIETTPLGIALMPEKWFTSVRPVGGDLKALDVCSLACATEYDKQFGRPDGEKKTVIQDIVDGELVTKTVEHEVIGA